MFPDKASSPGSILIVDDLRRSIHELVAARRDLADVVSKLPAFIADWDKALSNRYSNDIDAAGFGIDDGKTLAMHMQQVIGDAAFADMQDHLQAARQGSNVIFEVRFKSGSNRKQDADLFAQVALVPRQTSGENVGFLMLITDFTERKLAELALYDEKERIPVTLNSIGDAVIATDAQGVVTFINPIAESMTC